MASLAISGRARVADFAPALGVGGVDGVEHGVEPFGQLFLFGNGEGDARIPDAGFGAHEALAHGGGRDEEGSGDIFGGHAEDGLQDQRRAHAALDGRVGAGEHQREAAIGDGFSLPAAASSISSAISFKCSSPAVRVWRRRMRIGLAPAGDGQQPGIGIVGDAIGGPDAERRGKGLGQRVLGARDVAGAGREEGDEAAVAVARDALGGAESGPLGCLVGVTHFQSALGIWTGRISIEP